MRPRCDPTVWDCGMFMFSELFLFGALFTTRLCSGATLARR